MCTVSAHPALLRKVYAHSNQVAPLVMVMMDWKLELLVEERCLHPSQQQVVPEFVLLHLIVNHMVKMLLASYPQRLIM